MSKPTPPKLTADLAHVVGKHYTQTLTIPKTFKNERWIYETEKRDVILMAVSGKYAMVRRSGCMPYVCPLKDLS